MRKFRVNVGIIAFFLMSIVDVNGQYDQEIIAVGVRELSVGQVFKIAEQPKTIDSSFIFKELSYQILPRRSFSGYIPEKLAASRVSINRYAPKLYKSYAKLGFGTFTTPLAELHYNSLRTRKGAWGFDFEHLSSAGGVKDAADSGYSDNLLGLWGRAFLSKHVAEGHFGWERNANHYYGFDPMDRDISSDEIKQTFNEFGGGVKLHTYHRDSAKVAFVANLNGYYLTDNFDATETNISLDGWLNKRVENFIVELGGELISNNYKSSTNDEFTFLDSVPSIGPPERSYVMLTAKPMIRADVDNLQVNVGLDISYEKNLSGKGRFYPQAYVEYELFNGILVPFVEYTGGLQANSFNSLRKENPFVLSNLQNFAPREFSNDELEELKNTNNRFEFNGGIRGRFNERLSFSGKVTALRFKDMPFFVNDTVYSEQNRFSVIYEDGRSLGISGQIAYRHSEFLNLIAAIDLKDYNMDNGSEAWHKPESKFTLGAVYDHNDKLVAKFDMYYIGKRFVKSLLPIENALPSSDGSYQTSVDGYVDASLSAEYRYTKRLSAFLQFNNIIGGKYEKWYQFRTQPFQVLGGLTYSF